jgi:SAM-dependent methyltransferase
MRPNESWWIDYADQWHAECQQRRRDVPYYLVQEAFVCEYLHRCAPASVLEFGCGFGRHLRNLREVDGLELFGCDQSRTMLAGVGRWANDDWRRARVRLIEPRRRLPYEDKQFDVVFTVSVLIHIHPDDVADVLGELLRVASWHILHIENTPTDTARQTSAEHGGCWAHPLADLYARQGAALDPMEPFGDRQGVYRVVLDGAREPPDVVPLARRLHAVDGMFTRRCSEFDERVVAVEQRVSAAEQRAAEAQEGLAGAEQRLAAAERALAGAEQRCQGLREQLAGSQRAGSQLEARLSELRREFAANGRRLEEHVRRTAKLQAELSEAKKRWSRLRAELDEARAERDALVGSERSFHASLLRALRDGE